MHDHHSLEIPRYVARMMAFFLVFSVAGCGPSGEILASPSLTHSKIDFYRVSSWKLAHML